MVDTPTNQGHIGIEKMPSEQRCIFDAAAVASAALCGVSIDDVYGQMRGRARVSLARQMAMYLSREAAGATLSQVGTHFGRDRTTASHAHRLVTGLRREPYWDKRMSKIIDAIRTLEHAVGGLSNPPASFKDNPS